MRRSRVLDLPEPPVDPRLFVISTKKPHLRHHLMIHPLQSTRKPAARTQLINHNPSTPNLDLTPLVRLSSVSTQHATLFLNVSLIVHISCIVVDLSTREIAQSRLPPEEQHRDVQWPEPDIFGTPTMHSRDLSSSPSPAITLPSLPAPHFLTPPP